MLTTDTTTTATEPTYTVDGGTETYTLSDMIDRRQLLLPVGDN